MSVSFIFDLRWFNIEENINQEECVQRVNGVCNVTAENLCKAKSTAIDITVDIPIPIQTW